MVITDKDITVIQHLLGHSQRDPKEKKNSVKKQLVVVFSVPVMLSVSSNCNERLNAKNESEFPGYQC